MAMHRCQCDNSVELCAYCLRIAHDKDRAGNSN